MSEMQTSEGPELFQRMIRTASIAEIESHLIELRSGNQSDNMNVVKDFPRHYLISLSEDEFKNLIFLESKEIPKLVPPGSDRRLSAVAKRARQLPPTEARLSDNWDITNNFNRLR